ncbi:MAG TPA: hypothetical protein ENK44_10835, partial [Caldithrix abyssi]|nr:hypothetical protein [Caldithrix abyssi]
MINNAPPFPFRNSGILWKKLPMDRYAIIGYPLEHSASPRIHNTAFTEYGMDAVYEKLEIDPQNFDTAIRQIKKEDWRGFNVTIPHKQRIM